MARPAPAKLSSNTSTRRYLSKKKEKVKKESDKSKKEDFNKMSAKQIKNAIEVAVKNEDYELAAELRDKLTQKNE
jgi:protein-arginine kinase activator protein McsA